MIHKTAYKVDHRTSYTVTTERAAEIRAGMKDLRERFKFHMATVATSSFKMTDVHVTDRVDGEYAVFGQWYAVAAKTAAYDWALQKLENERKEVQ